MIKCLENMRMGVVEPHNFKQLETARRSFTLELSKFRDVEKVFRGSVNTLDVEHIEGRYLLSGVSDGSLYIHDLENLTGKPDYTSRLVCEVHSNSFYAHKHSVETVQWYPQDTGMFISSGMDHHLKVWDTNSMKPADTYKLPGRVYQHHMSSISTKHCLIAVASSSSHLSLLDLKTGSCTHELRGHRKGAVSVKWSTRNEHLLASGSNDNRILLWDVRSSRGYLKCLDQHGVSGDASSEQVATAHNGTVNGLCFTNDGLFLLSYGTDRRLKLWNAFTGKLELVNYGKIYNDSKKAMRFDVSRDSLHDLIYVPSEENVLVYDLHNGSKVSTFLGHFNNVNCCVVHPFYQDVYSGANDRNVLIWTADAEQSRALEEERMAGKAAAAKKNGINRRNNVTADAWSSDDD